MIHKCRVAAVARARRIELQRILLPHLKDLQAEAKFESSLAAAVMKNDDRRLLERCFSGPHLNAWSAPLTSRLALIQAAFERDACTAGAPASAEGRAAQEGREQDARARVSAEGCSHMVLPLAEFIKTTNRSKKKKKKHSTSKPVSAPHSYTPIPSRNVKVCA